MTSNPCPDCGRERGTGQTVLGVDDAVEVVLSEPHPVAFCEPCSIGIDPVSKWPRARRPEFRDLPRTACGWAEKPDGTLIAPADQF